MVAHTCNLLDVGSQGSRTTMRPPWSAWAAEAQQVPYLEPQHWPLFLVISVLKVIVFAPLFFHSPLLQTSAPLLPNPLLPITTITDFCVAKSRACFYSLNMVLLPLGFGSHLLPLEEVFFSFPWLLWHCVFWKTLDTGFWNLLRWFSCMGQHA